MESASTSKARANYLTGFFPIDVRLHRWRSDSKFLIFFVVALTVAMVSAETEGQCTPDPGCQSDPRITTQLCIAVDGSVSITEQEFSLMREGLAAAIGDPTVMPRDGSVELTVIQFGTRYDGFPQLVGHTVLTAIDGDAIASVTASQLRAMSQIGGLTPMSLAIDACSCVIRSSCSSATKKVINLVTDGAPTGHSNFDNTVLSREAAIAAGVHEVNAEAVGVSDQTFTYLRDRLVWPQPGYEAPPFAGGGFVIRTSTFQDFAAAIRQKIAHIVATPTPTSPPPIVWTPTRSRTQTPTITPTITPTRTPTRTPTVSSSTHTRTPSATRTRTNTNTPTPTRTPTATRTHTSTRTATRTRTATPTLTQAPHSTPTFASPPTSTPSVVQQPALLFMPESSGVPGQITTFSVLLDTKGNSIDGIEVEVEIEGPATLSVGLDGRTCRVNPSIRKQAFFALYPPGCELDLSCFVVKGIVHSFGDNPIPDGAELFTCDVAILANAVNGDIIRVVLDRAGASGLDGHDLHITTEDGRIVVGGGLPSTPSPTAPPPATQTHTPSFTPTPTSTLTHTPTIPPTPTHTSVPTLAPATPTPSHDDDVCAAPGLDVAILIDGSGSVDADDWLLQKEGFARAIEDPSKTPHDGSVCALIIKYGSNASVDVPFTCIDNGTIARDFAGAIRTLRRPTGDRTGVVRALSLAIDRLAQHARPNARQVIQLATDGLPNTPQNCDRSVARPVRPCTETLHCSSLDAEAQRARERGIDEFNVIAVEDPLQSNGPLFENDFLNFYGCHVFPQPNTGGDRPEPGFVVTVRDFDEFANVVANQLPAGGGNSRVDLADSAGRPGSTVTLRASLSAPCAEIAAAGSDIVFDPTQLAGGCAQCRIDPTIGPGTPANKALSCFEEMVDTDGDGQLDSRRLRVAAVTANNVNLIPDGALLSCDLRIADSVFPGDVLRVRNAPFGATPQGVDLAFVGRNATISVGASCACDCNGDGRVSIGEVVQSVGVFLGREPLSACPAADGNFNGLVSIGEVVQCIRAFLEGCQ